MRDEVNAMLAEMGNLELDVHGVCSLIVNDTHRVSIEVPPDTCMFMLHSKVASRSSNSLIVEKALGINLRLAGRIGSKLALDQTNGDIIYIYTSDASLQDTQELINLLSIFTDNAISIASTLATHPDDKIETIGNDFYIRV